MPHNLNVSFNFVEGETLIMAIKDIAVSSGSACTSASLEPSYVLRALGRSDELAHSSIRFTIGRFTTEEEIDYTVDLLKRKVGKLRELSSAVGNVQGRRRPQYRRMGGALTTPLRIEVTPVLDVAGYCMRRRLTVRIQAAPGRRLIRTK